MYEMVTLKECKAWLNIEGTDADKDTILNYMIDWITAFIETYTNKQMITRSYTEFQDGNRQKNMLTKFYPVYSVESLHDDADNLYGASELIATTDYRIYYDRGEIRLTNDEYKFLDGEQNIKVVYRAGFSRFLLVDESNNYLDIKESTSSTDFPIEIAPPSAPVGKFQGYDAEGLASAIQTALNASNNLTLEYAVAYNQMNKTFTFSSGIDFDLKWSSGDSVAKNMAALLGFSTGTDTNDGTSHVSSGTDANIGIPNDLKMAALSILDFVYNESSAGKGHLSEIKKSLPHGEGTMELIKKIPNTAREILDSYTGIV